MTQRQAHTHRSYWHCQPIPHLLNTLKSRKALQQQDLWCRKFCPALITSRSLKKKKSKHMWLFDVMLIFTSLSKKRSNLPFNPLPFSWSIEKKITITIHQRLAAVTRAGMKLPADSFCCVNEKSNSTTFEENNERFTHSGIPCWPLRFAGLIISSLMQKQMKGAGGSMWVAVSAQTSDRVSPKVRLWWGAPGRPWSASI